MLTLQDQMARLEEAFRRPVPSVFDPRPIEELARRIENVRVTVERQADFRPHAAKLEAALSDINSKLDRPPAASTDTKVLTCTLQDMTARLDEAFRRPATALKFDPEPLDDLVRRSSDAGKSAVAQSIAKSQLSLTDFAQLISPAGAENLETLCRRSQALDCCSSGVHPAGRRNRPLVSKVASNSPRKPIIIKGLSQF